VKINVVKWVNVLNTIEGNKAMLNAFLKFYERLNEAQWTKPNDVYTTFNEADLVKCKKGNRFIFNVGGNKYRLVCGYHFGRKYIFLFVKFVGSHSDYNRIEICNVDMFN